RMDVEHDRLALAIVDALNGAAHQPERRQAEKPAAADRNIDAEEPQCADRKFGEGGSAVPENLVGKARSARLSVTVVHNRVHARVVAEALLEQRLVRPGLARADGEVRRPKAEDWTADDILQARFRAAEIAAEPPRRLTADVFVPVAMAANLVFRGGDDANDRRMRPGDLAESEEGRAGAGIVQQRQQLLDAPLHAAFKATRPQAARRRPEDARVE